MNRRTSPVFTLLGVPLLLGAVALTAPRIADAAKHSGAEPSTQTSSDTTEGEVRRINKELGKITLRHGELKALGMPPMTMVFNIRNPALLDAVKVGDTVLFTAAKDADGSFVITAIKPAR